MRQSLSMLLLAGAAIAGTGAADAAMSGQRPVRSTSLPRPRDGDIAIREELDAARRARTLAAYDLFLARHPGHALERTARRERQRIVRAQRDRDPE